MGSTGSSREAVEEQELRVDTDEKLNAVHVQSQTGRKNIPYSATPLSPHLES